ncbi:phosphoglucosamine mutase [Neptunomonas concharum]|uniref:Phosphoglucosamine mutase n=1 Tax=Neptunomonas concharum TaxID=1031538 RepID=A0A5P1RE94_9GAMM|nr:phosphoglucosamine mutase [Neptunomonas concharum]QEQ97964.1 phosphoglucosamine mutase [Neptunomonas concharum]
MSKRYFGTDGIRGKVGQFPITPDFMLKLGWAAGKVFAREGHSKILIGKDTRISGYMFESALEAGLSAAGVDVLLTGPMPTPAIAYLTRTFQANAGIVISASHNAFGDNGIKFFSTEGTKLPDALEHAIEAQMDLVMTTVDSASLGKVRRVPDAPGRYIEFCKSTVPLGFSLSGLKIVLDCANGATYHVAPEVLRELGAVVIEVASAPDGLNINEACGATAPQRLQKVVVAEKADLGIALDGDGDRLIMVDHLGEVIDGDEVLFIIVQRMHEREALSGGVVGTLMTNFGFERAMNEMSVPFIRADVGDRYVMAALAERDWILGGESSGHIVCRHLTSTGDGIISALQVLRAMRETGKSLHDLKCGMSKLPQVMINVKMPKRVDLRGVDAVQSAVKDTESQLGDSGRVLLRPSGTEPVVRVMIEGEDKCFIEKLCKELAEEVRNALEALVTQD